MRNKTYPLRTILEAVTDYHLGYPLTEVSARLKVQRSLRVSPSTIATWLADHREHTSYHRLRARGKNLFSPTTTIRAIKLYHRQVYEFAYYRPKLTLLRQGALDEKRRRDAHFASLADFLEATRKVARMRSFETAKAVLTSQERAI